MSLTLGATFLEDSTLAGSVATEDGSAPTFRDYLRAELELWAPSGGLEIAMKETKLWLDLIMKTHLSEPPLLTAALLAASMIMLGSASAQENRSGASAAASTVPTGASENQNQPSVQTDTSSAASSTGIADILKLSAAGVSNEVIKTFIQTSPVAYNLSAADIIALKTHGVPDDLTTALLKRGAELRDRALPAAAGPAAQGAPPRPASAPVAAPAYPTLLDPNSYDYFQYYYLYPRTLASFYQTLYGYQPRLSYGYFRPVPYGPHF